MSDGAEATPAVRLDFRSGGWALVLAGLLCALAVWLLVLRGRSANEAAAASLPEPCLLPREHLLRAAFPQAIPPLNDPRTFAAEDAMALKMGRIKFLVNSDLVIGVRVGEEARAYPLRLLRWHEVINDTLGGQDVCVTYHPLSGSARVFARQGAEDRRSLRFASSGVLHHSTMILSDNAAEMSLWSQLQGRAIAGRAAAAREELRPLAHELLRWSDWFGRHPQTRVAAPEESRKLLLKHDPYVEYRGSDTLRFPCEPLPPASAGLPLKTPVLVVRAGGERRVYPLPWLIDKAALRGEWETTQGGVPLHFRVRDTPPSATVSAPGGEEVDALRCYWFAWFATHPEDATLAGR